MRKDKANISIAGAVIIVVLAIILACVVPWTLSLVDSTPGTGTSTQFKGVLENAQHAYIAERIEVFVGVEVYSFYANLQWGNDDGTCTIQATVQNGNGVYDPPLVEFTAIPYTMVDRGEFGRINYLGTTLSGVYEFIPAGDYWFVLHVSCTEANQFLYWRWYHSDFGAVFSPAVVSPNGPCLDFDFNHFWEDDECSSDDSSYILEGRVYDPGGEPIPPPDDNVTDDGPPPLVDTTVDEVEDNTWLYILIVGAVVFIVIVAVVVMIKT